MRDILLENNKHERCKYTLEKTEGAIKAGRTTQRHWQYWAHKTQDKDKQSQKKPKQHNTEI